MEVIRTKFAPSARTADVLVRPRLVDLCSRVLAHRLTLVRAPAGYGKTTLLVGWHAKLKAENIAVVWLTLDRRERMGDRLVASLAAAIENEGLLGVPLGAFVDEESDRPSLEDRVAVLVDRMAAIEGPVVLMLDNIAVVNDAASAALADLLRNLPPNAHMVMASRRCLSVGAAALRAYGEVFDIGAGELAFTAEEAARHLARTSADALQPAEIAELTAKTEGWVTGLNLAIAGMDRGRDATAWLAEFSGRCRPVADFFAENVMTVLNEEECQFLLEISIHERFTTALCNAVGGRNDARDILRRLQALGAFVFDDQAGGLRLHRLFAEFLRQELADTDRARFMALHARAARLLQGQSDFLGALHHASQVQDHELLADILEESAEPLTYTGRLAAFARYAAQLPDRLLKRSPWTLVSLAWLHIRGLRAAEGERLLALARARIKDLRRASAGDAADLEALERIVQHREMVLAAARDDAGQVEELCVDLMRHFTGSRPYLACTLYAQLIAARREQYRFDDLEKLHAQGCATAEQAGYRFALVALHSAAGISLLATGRSDAAVGVLNKGLSESFRFAGPNSGLAALVALPLAEIAYERNDRAEAAAYLDAYMPVARELCFVDQLVAGHVVASRLRAAEGDAAGAERALDDALNVALECDLERLRLAVVNEQVRLLIRNGRPEEAARQADRAGVGAVGSLGPQARSTTTHELRAVIAARISISQNRVAESLSVIRHWRTFCQQRGAVRSHIRWSLLMAQALMINGEAFAAQRVMREAIGAAAPANAVRSFVDEGAAVLTILSDAYLDAPPTTHPSDIFARRVLEAFDWKRPYGNLASVSEDGLYGRLSAKELEILTLVGCGMRNREIGNRLGLTEGSVKWYMQQVYDKVGIRRRSQAVERARQFGLIP